MKEHAFVARVRRKRHMTERTNDVCRGVRRRLLVLACRTAEASERNTIHNVSHDGWIILHGFIVTKPASEILVTATWLLFATAFVVLATIFAAASSVVETLRLRDRLQHFCALFESTGWLRTSRKFRLPFLATRAAFPVA
jgi:hypothetical protein